MPLKLSACVLLLVPGCILAQGDWIYYNSGNSPLEGLVYEVQAAPDGSVWIGGRGQCFQLYEGIWSSYDPVDGSNTYQLRAFDFDQNGTPWAGFHAIGKRFNQSWENSALLPNAAQFAGFGGVREMAFDAQGTLWTISVFLSGSGNSISQLISWDDLNPADYFDDINSTTLLPVRYPVDLIVDDDQNKWIASSGWGLARFNDGQFELFNEANSNLPSDLLHCLAYRQDGTLWIGTDNGLAIYQNGDFQVFYTGNSPLPADQITEITFDQQGDAWIGVENALVKYDGADNWSVYNMVNSPIPIATPQKISVDQLGNKWLVLNNDAVAVFNENEVLYTFPTSPVNHTFSVFPNPVKAGQPLNINTEWTGPFILSLYDAFGRLNSAHMLPQHQIETTNLPAGTYLLLMDANGTKSAAKFIIMP
jgi:streptogramin lyase